MRSVSVSSQVKFDTFPATNKDSQSENTDKFLTPPKLNDPGADDGEEGEELGGGEHVLHPGRPLDLVAVDEGQDADADGRQQPHSLVRRLALWIIISPLYFNGSLTWEKRFAGIFREGQRNNCL